MKLGLRCNYSNWRIRWADFTKLSSSLDKWRKLLLDNRRSIIRLHTLYTSCPILFAVKYEKFYLKYTYWNSICNTGDHVSLQFTHLDLSNWAARENCSLYSLKVFDGRTSTSPLLGNYCSRQIPHTITSQVILLLLWRKSPVLWTLIINVSLH